MSLNVGDLVAELKVDKALWNSALAALPREVARSGNSAEAQARTQGTRIAGGLGSSFQNALGGGLVGGAIASVMYSGVRTAEQVVGKGLAVLKQDVFGFNSTLQNSTIAFTTMLGSGTKAQSFLSQLQSFAKSTPFEFQGLVQNSQLMMGMGVSAKNVIPYLTALGDSTASVGGSGEVLNQTILAFSQTMAKGTLDMGNMNQLLQGGVPNALKILAAQYHVTTGAMVKMISTGKVQSSVALPLLVKGIEKGTSATAALGGMMDKQSATWSGAVSNISDGSQQLLAKAFRPLFDESTKGAMSLAGALGSAKADEWAHRTSVAVSEVLAWFRRIKGAVDLSAVSRDFRTLFGAVRPIVVALAPLVGALIAVAKAIGPFGLAGKALMPILPILGKNLAEIASSVGTGLAPAFATILPLLAGLVGWVVQLASPILTSKGAVVAIVGALAAWKLATMAMAAYKAVFAGYAAATYGIAGAELVAGNARKVYAVLTKGMAIAQGIATAAQWALNAAMDANPIGLIVLAVVGLVGALVWFFTQTKAGQQIWSGFVGFLKGAWAGFADWFGKAIKAVIGFVVKWGPLMLAAVLPIVGIPLLVIQHWGEITAFFGKLPGVLGKLLVAAGKAILVGIVTGIAMAVVAVHYFFTKFPSDLRGWVSTAATWLVNTGRSILTGLSHGITTGWTAVVSWFKALPGHVKDFVVGAERWYVSTGTSILKGLVSGAVTGWRAVVSWFKGIPGWVVKFVTGAAHWYVSTGTSLLRGLVSGAVTGYRGVVSFLSGLPGKIIGFLAGAPQWLVSAGVNVVQGFLNGVRSLAGTIGSFFLSLLPGWIVGPFKAAMGIKSPSTVFHTLGLWLMKGLANGIASGTQAQVKTAMANTVAMIKDAHNKAADALKAAREKMAKLQRSYNEASTKKSRQHYADLISDQKTTIAQWTRAASGAVESSLLKMMKTDNAKLAAEAKKRDGYAAQIKNEQGVLDQMRTDKANYASSVASAVVASANVANSVQDTETAHQAASDKITTISDQQTSLAESAAAHRTSAAEAASTVVAAQARLNALVAAGKLDKDAAVVAAQARLDQAYTNQKLDAAATAAAKYQPGSTQAIAAAKRAAADVTAITTAQSSLDGARVAAAKKQGTDAAALAAAQTALLKARDNQTAAQATVQKDQTAAASLQSQKDAAVAATKTSTVGALLTRLRKTLSDTWAFRSVLAKLRKEGLDDTTYDQLVQAGVEGGGLQVAQDLLNSGVGTVKTVAKLQTQLDQAATGLGNSTAASMYNAGINSAKGIIAGLKDSESEVTKAMDRIADAMINSIKKKLKIKSPSGAFAEEVGVHIPSGVAVGIDRGQGALDARIAKMVKPTRGGAGLSVGLGSVGSGAPQYSAHSSLVIHGNVGWDPHEVARQTAQRQRQAAALAGFTTGAGVLVA